MDAISVVMPYYNRQFVTDRTLDSYQYGDDVEVIVVDDGSPIPFKGKVKVIRLPEKTVGYSPVIPINIGVEYASHDLIAISLPEVRHQSQVLYAMRDAWKPGGYVSARCWCESMGRWLAGPDVEAKGGLQGGKPKGIPFNFCVLFHRDLWNKVGGMSREYRWGSHYDDTDFAQKLAKEGITCTWVDDVVIHSREQGARAPWIQGGASRNKKIFYDRWNV